MSVHKRYTNKNKTKYNWGYWITLPSTEYKSDGTPIRKQVTKFGFSTKKKAQEAEKAYLEELNRGNIETNKELIFDNIIDFFLDYAELEAGYEEGTISNYRGFNRNHLLIFHGVNISNITDDLISAWKRDRLKAGASIYTINDCIKLLKASFNYAKSKKKVKINPFEDIKKLPLPKKLRRRFSTEKLKIIIKSCFENMPEFFCIFILATLTGMRVGEYSALTKADIDFDTGEVYVTKQFTRGKLKNRTKTIGSTRIVHISLKVRGIIKWHIRKYEIFTGFLFKDSIGQPVSAKWVSRKFKNLLKLNGYPEDFCRVHDLRGQYVDIMKAIGISTSYISREVGHSRTSTTDMYYTQILEEVYEMATTKLDEKIFS